MAMRRGFLTIGMMGLVAALVGCAAEVGPATAGLAAADVDALTTQTLYLVDGVDRPLTLAEVEEGQRAIPVRVEVFENSAAAWYAPNDEAIISRDTLLALWEVYDTVEGATPTNGVLSDVGTPVVVDSARTEEEPSFEVPGQDAEIDVEVRSAPGLAILTDFEDRLLDPEMARLMRDVLSGHPGCL
jgi:hypothetical protein